MDAERFEELKQYVAELKRIELGNQQLLLEIKSTLKGGFMTDLMANLAAFGILELVQNKR